MMFDGRKRAREVQEAIAHACSGRALVVVSVAPDAASMSYMRTKQRVGEAVGVNVEIVTVAPDAIESTIEQLAADTGVDGIVVQLPLPEGIDTEKVLQLIPPAKDPDALGTSPRVASPVARAVLDIVESADIDFAESQVVVIGKGKLVGLPVAQLLYAKGAHLTILDADTDTDAFEAALKDADVIVSGAGVPGLIQPHMLTRGVVLVDAGTSEQAGAIVGDADPACESLCAVMTPVPGGVGPLAITMLFANLADLSNT